MLKKSLICITLVFSVVFLNSAAVSIANTTKTEQGLTEGVADNQVGTVLSGVKLASTSTTKLADIFDMLNIFKEGDEAKDAWTLVKAINYALENNIDIQLAELDYDQAYAEASDDAESVGNSTYDTVIDFNYAQDKYVVPEQRSLAVDIARQTYYAAKEELEISVEQAFYNVLKAENNVEIAEAAIKRVQEELRLVEKKYEAGTAVKTELNRAEINLDNARLNLVNAQRELKNTQVAFNKVLGLDIQEEVKLAHVLENEQATLPTVDDLTEEALENSISLQRAKNNQTIAELNFDLAKEYSASATTQRRYRTQLEKAKLEVKKAEQNAKSEVISSLFQAEKAGESLQLSTKSLKAAQDNYKLELRRYEIGVSSYTDVLAAAGDLMQTEARYIEAVYNYTIAVKQMEMLKSN